MGQPRAPVGACTDLSPDITYCYTIKHSTFRYRVSDTRMCAVAHAHRGDTVTRLGKVRYSYQEKDQGIER